MCLHSIKRREVGARAIRTEPTASISKLYLITLRSRAWGEREVLDLKKALRPGKTTKKSIRFTHATSLIMALVWLHQYLECDEWANAFMIPYS